MSINTAMRDENVLLYHGESVLLFVKNVVLEFGSQPGPEFKGNKKGVLYLTTHRAIFGNKDKNDKMQNFSIPFVALSELGLEQPIFGANYITGVVTSQENGNWSGKVKVKLTFNDGGTFIFGEALIRAANFAKRHQAEGPPPPYVPTPDNIYPAPPPAYHPNPQGYYGWMPPTNTFPSAPPANTLYVMDAPPPYPGIYGPSGQYATASCPPPADSKAAEAAQPAYYDPSKPQYAYVQPPFYYENPPTYQEAVNKKQE